MSLHSHDCSNNTADYSRKTRSSHANAVFRCLLCKNKLRDSRILCSNGHIFCLNCIQNSLPDLGVMKCPICKEVHRFSTDQEFKQIPKTHTLQILKRVEHHRIAQLGCCKCMKELEQYIADEHSKEHTELLKIRSSLQERISQWDQRLIESKNNIRERIQNDAEQRIKEIQNQEQALYKRLDDLYRTYSTIETLQLQKLKIDIDKESTALDQVDPTHWSVSDRLFLSQRWINLQRQLDEQSIDFVYKQRMSLATEKHLGDIDVKALNQDNEYFQREKLDSRHNQIPCQHLRRIGEEGQEVNTRLKKRMITVEENSTKSLEKRDEFRTSMKYSISQSGNRYNDCQIEPDDYEYSTKKVVRIQHRRRLSDPSTRRGLFTKVEQQHNMDNTQLTPRVPIAPVNIEDYNRKATQILTGLDEADKFLAPTVIAVTDTNQLLITDTRKHRIVIYDLQSKTMRTIKGFLFPDGLCVANEQYVIITDHHRISKYDWIYGKMVSFIGSKKEGCTRSTFSRPKGVAIDNNYAYVCDSYNSRMVVLTHQMRYENEWPILRDTKKLDPQYISISNNLLYVTAWQRVKPETCAYNAGCIIVYTTDGRVQRLIDIDAHSYLNLSVPESIICYSSNQFILADQYTSKISVVNCDDEQQVVIHFHGDRMKAPYYVCFSNNQKTMIVADIGNNTIQFYDKNSRTHLEEPRDVK